MCGVKVEVGDLVCLKNDYSRFSSSERNVGTFIVSRGSYGVVTHISLGDYIQVKFDLSAQGGLSCVYLKFSEFGFKKLFRVPQV